jgi:hypothetical protein
VEVTYKEFIQNILDTRGRFACGEKYHERHHIVPKCMNGGNEEENLIDLFAKEHFIAHKLLAQENPYNYKLVYAYGCMAFVKRNDMERYELTPEEYEGARIVFSEASSIQAKKRFSNPENNPMYGKHHSEETKQKIRESESGKFDGTKNPFYGQHHTDESLIKMRGNRSSISGENNPMYGRPWWDDNTPQEKIDAWRTKKPSFKSGEENLFFGKTHSPETKAMLSTLAKERTGDKNPNYGKGNPVVQLTKDLKEIRRYTSSNAVQRETGYDSSGVRRCCEGNMNRTCEFLTSHGYIWMYADHYDKNYNI